MRSLGTGRTPVRPGPIRAMQAPDDVGLPWFPAPGTGTTVSAARHVGRVGALAVALGIGWAAASMPVAFADTRGSSGAPPARLALLNRPSRTELLPW